MAVELLDAAGSEAPDLGAELHRVLALIFADGGIRELRVLDATRSQYPLKTPHVEVGYFKPEEAERIPVAAAHYRRDPGFIVLAGSKLATLTDRPRGVYYTLNPVKTAAYAKAPGLMTAGRDVSGSSDSDIARRTLLLVDVDAPREVAGVSATDEEKSIAIALAQSVVAFLTDSGWPGAAVIDSGNGIQLLYRIDLPADDDGMVERVLKGLAARFPCRDGGGIDTSVHNPARLARLPCTWNAKGHSVEDRPHRLARVLKLPDRLDCVSIEQLESVAEQVTAEPSRDRRAARPKSKSRQRISIQDAAAKWNADNPTSFSRHAGPCPICGSPDGLKESCEPGRWTCFSSRHASFEGDRDRGAGLKGEGCYHGDALDLACWSRQKTRKQVLEEDGYLRGSQGENCTASECHDPSPETAVVGSDRMQVYYHNEHGDVPLHELVATTITLLVQKAQDRVYVHGDVLSHVIVVDAASDAGVQRSEVMRIREYPAAAFRELLDSVARWTHEHRTPKGELRSEDRWCPKDLAQALLQRGEWPGIRPLDGVTQAPVLRPDLSVLDTPGYDVATRILYRPHLVYPSVPQEPSADELTSALSDLMAPFADFPMVGETDRACLLAYMLTLAGRPAIRGPVPMTLVTARVPGTGKTLLLECATMAMTGHAPDTMMMPGGRAADAEAEWRKRITTLALEAPRAVMVDNIPDGEMLASCQLAAALTSTELSDRLLATNRTARVPHRMVWTANGNNVSVAGDLARRTLLIDLDARIEDPHLRRTFKVPDLVRHVLDLHPRLLTAALTLLRGYAVVGCPSHGAPALGKFESWDGLVRGCTVWLMAIDPVSSQDRLRAESSDIGALAAVLLNWDEVLGSQPVQASDLLAKPTIATALAEAIPAGNDRDLPSSRSVGKWLQRNLGRVLQGLWIETAGSRQGTKLWKLGRVA